MKKILIVDDEEKIRRIYTSLLASEGFKVIATSNPVDANEILKREHIDLVLLDIKMPQINGSIIYEIMQIFHRKVKVIVASVYPLEEQKHIIKDAVDYYDKSQGVALLLKKVKQVLRNERKPRKKILIIDDEPRIRSLFSRQLKEVGYCGMGVPDGETALKLLKKNEDIDLAILDISLSHSSGIDVFEMVKESFPHLKIIVASVYPKNEQEFLIWDADDYYYKSEEISVLIDKVYRLTNS